MDGAVTVWALLRSTSLCGDNTRQRSSSCYLIQSPFVVVTHNMKPAFFIFLLTGFAVMHYILLLEIICRSHCQCGLIGSLAFIAKTSDDVLAVYVDQLAGRNVVKHPDYFTLRYSFSIREWWVELVAA